LIESKSNVNVYKAKYILLYWLKLGEACHYGFSKKTGLTEGYVDLEKYAETKTSETSSAKMHVAVGEIQRYEDIKAISDYVYGGNVLILDFSPISDEEVILKRIT